MVELVQFWYKLYKLYTPQPIIHYVREDELFHKFNRCRKTLNYTLSQKKRAPYNNVNNIRTKVPIHSPFGATLGLPNWHILTNFCQYIWKNEDSGEFSARKGCATQWPSWEISMSVTKSHCRPIVLFHDVARSCFVLSALAYVSQTADRPVGLSRPRPITQNATVQRHEITP